MPKIRPSKSGYDYPGFEGGIPMDEQDPRTKKILRGFGVLVALICLGLFIVVVVAALR